MACFVSPSSENIQLYSIVTDFYLFLSDLCYFALIDPSIIFTATGIRTQISSSDDVGRLMLLIPIQYVLIASPSVGTYLAALADLNA